MGPGFAFGNYNQIYCNAVTIGQNANSKSQSIHFFSGLYTFVRLLAGAFFFFLLRLKSMALRTKFFRADALTLSPSRKSIARQTLPPKPALNRLSGSGKLAP